MKDFFKYTLATITGLIVFFSLLFVVGILMLLGAVAAFNADQVTSISPNSVLHLKLNQPVNDRSSHNPVLTLGGDKLFAKPEPGLNDILSALKKAKRDTDIKGIFLDLTTVPSGIATLEEIRNGLLDFKSSGKFILAYSDDYSQAAYYLATVADKIYLNPYGAFDFKGIHAEVMFFKGTLDKLAIEPQIIRHGKFKSAVEPLITDRMSPENRRQTAVYVNSIWNHLLNTIATARNIGAPELQAIADSLKTQDADDALKYRMVDTLAYRDQCMDDLRKKLSVRPGARINFVSLSRYVESPDKIKTKGVVRDRIAIVYAEGTIESGKGIERSVGDRDMAIALRKARTDTHVKAVVLRINSPGGSALASENIWREVMLTKAKKPVVVSMGDMAASGGYYIAAGADVVVAQPNTVTGSIGVFGILLNAGRFLKEKLGITIDTVKSAALADYGSIYRPAGTNELGIAQKSVEKVYTTFVNRVAKGRKFSEPYVDSIGQGRVWTGADALQIGLVDTLGGMDLALAIAAKKAGVKDYKVIELPEEKPAIQKLIEELLDEEDVLVKKKMGAYYPYYKQAQLLFRTNSIQARLPYLLEIK